MMPPRDPNMSQTSPVHSRYVAIDYGGYISVTAGAAVKIGCTHNGSGIR